VEQRSEARILAARHRALGSAIRRHRSEMNQTELAGQLGVSQSAISQWETGVAHVTIEQLSQVERALHLRSGTLLIEAGYVDQNLLGPDAVAALALVQLQASLGAIEFLSGVLESTKSDS